MQPAAIEVSPTRQTRVIQRYVVPGIRRILPLAVSGLLLIPHAQAASKWDCRATSNGEWECLKEGLPVTADSTLKAPTPRIQEPADNTPGDSEETTTISLPEAAPTPTASPANEVVESSLPEATAAPPTPETGREERATASTPPRQEMRESATRRQTEPKTAEQKSASGAVADDAAPVADRSGTAATPPRRPGESRSKPLPEVTAPAVSDSIPREETTTSTAKTGKPVIATATGGTADAGQRTLLETHSDPRIDRGLNWNQCSGTRAPLVARPTPAVDDNTRIEADAADIFRQEERAEFAGNVQVEHANERLEADRVSYNRRDNTLDAEGQVYLEQPGLRVTGSRLHYQLDRRAGQAEQAEFRLTDSAARGYAASAEMLNADQSRYNQAAYTTCPPGNSDWLINADELEIDQSTGVGVARNASLRFKGVPFIYLPYATFPIDDRRMSGFLPPSIGTSENTGADFSIPYYFNIAPAMDATLTSRIMSKRGLLLGGEFRYLAERSRGEIQAELLPNDSERAAGENSTRGALNIRADGKPLKRWRYEVDLNYVSDNDYINDLGNSLAATSVRHQERRGDIRYQGDGWNLLGRAQYYQTIDRTIAVNDRPYSRLPQLLLNLEKPDQAMGLTYHLRSEYVQFEHSSNSKVKGDRFDLQPAISLPLRRPWGFFTPKLSLRHTRYDLENQTPGLNSSPSRTLPTLSLDGGLYFDRPTNWFGSTVTQTLEPRLFYLYTPHEDQSAIPDLDTSELDFSFANLFRDNRFSGSDKIGDANQLTTALTSRSLSRESGEELLRASIGQILYFRDREVQLTSASPVVDDDSSAIVAEVATRLSRNWRLQGGIQWNPHQSDGATERSAIGLHYADPKQRILNLAYRYTAGTIEQTDLSARWPISHQVHLVGRWNYSLLHEKTMESFAGIEYNSCCWITRFVVRDYRSDANSEGNLALFLQLELKGLTSLGDKIDQFLERGILGYRNND